ncbi:hypothetical protein ILUMI_08965 [Ignelater luminosus]|uniref:Helicase C-terminal domain-containing protein n=1 Tax=Ignelater luminosus TaxID=2038154 RepID=A0A8K0GFI1_IGNLU|nr:hypothetical protein ILUMI_08965 [Ignelater luminosus]
MLQGEDLDPSETTGQEELNLLEQLSKMNLNDAPDEGEGLQIEDAAVGLAQASRNIMNPSHPVFAQDRKSTKIKAIMKLLNEIPAEDKVIIISQWTKFLALITIQLQSEKMKFHQLDGSINVNKRMQIVDSFNSSSNKVRILLLSLTAGGVGLNLIGANHLILADLHWNPQLETQAQDRIYRVGQTKPVTIYKLIANDTIEYKIKLLQDRKLGIAEELLTGAKIQQHNKLSLEDLKMLFNM